MAFQNAAWKIQLLDKAVVWATFYFQQKEIFNVFDHLGERPVSNIIVLKPKTQ